MNEDFEKYLRRANRDIQGANNHEELKSYIACILYDNDKKDKEIEMLNNIINGMEKYIIYNLDYWNKESSQRSYLIKDTLTNTLNTLRKLKRKDNE